MLVILVVVFFTGGFYVSGLLFLTTDTPLWLLRPWRLPTALSSTLATFGCFTFTRLFRHSFTVRRSGVFYLALLPQNFGKFCDSDAARTRHPASSFVPALTELSLPTNAWTGTTHIEVTRPKITRVKIKLLNLFRLFKVIRKDYKNTLNQAW